MINTFQADLKGGEGAGSQQTAQPQAFEARVMDKTLQEKPKESVVKRKTPKIKKTFRILAILILIGALGLGAYFVKKDYDLNQIPDFIEQKTLEVQASPYTHASGNTYKEVREPYEPVQKYASTLINSLSADVVYAYDPDSLQIFAAKNIEKKAHIASITKLVSVLVILEKYKLTDTVVFTGKYYSWDNPFGVLNGDRMTVEDALKVMLIPSKNDVAEEFADMYPNGGRAGFLKRMNEIAGQLNMKNSSFDTPSGLWEGASNYSTAYDLRLLVGHVLANDFVMQQVGRKSATVSVTSKAGKVSKRTIYTTNGLMGSVPQVRGLKTGYTRLAGECFVGYFVWETSGLSDEGVPVENTRGKGVSKRLVTVVLSSANRFGESKRLVR